MKTGLPEDMNRDLGFGSVVASESRQRLLNRNGSFNVGRTGLSWIQSHSLYQSLLTISWTRFLLLGSLLYLTANLLFAFIYLLCGADALQSPEGNRLNSAFLRAFFFSVQTLATIGYGHISPSGIAANIVVTLESLFGLLGLALMTGLLFARFSRPIAAIIYSQTAVIAPYGDGTAFEFRITNARNNQLLELEAKVLFARFEGENGKRIRRFYQLDLERNRVSFFPLSWTIVHPITESSPIYGLTIDDLRESEAEFLILLVAIDETFSQTVHSRSSYRHDELVWNAKFANVFNRPSASGNLTVDVRRLHHIERLQERSQAAD